MTTVNGFKSSQRALRRLPIDQRADLLVQMFRFVAREFAAMVLEHVKSPAAKRLKRRSTVTRRPKPKRRATRRTR